MSTSKYRVCNHRSVCLLDGTLLKQGQPLPTGIGKALVREWVSSGFIYEAGQDPNPPAPSQAVIPSEGHLNKARKRPEPIQVPSKIKTNGKYTYDPKELEGKTLEELNLLLVNLDTDPADTEEEAIGVLSSDFKAD